MMREKISAWIHRFKLWCGNKKAWDVEHEIRRQKFRKAVEEAELEAMRRRQEREAAWSRSPFNPNHIASFSGGRRYDPKVYARPATCWCEMCNVGTRFAIPCPECGDKRCARSEDHRNVCSRGVSTYQQSYREPTRTPDYGDDLPFSIPVFNETPAPAPSECRREDYDPPSGGGGLFAGGGASGDWSSSNDSPSNDSNDSPSDSPSGSDA